MATDPNAGRAGDETQSAGTDDFDDSIDWAELQAFFFEHLRDQLAAMEGLVAKRDLTTLARIGHSLKGSGGGVRLPHFTDLGRALEDAAREGDLLATFLACRALRDAHLAQNADETGAVAALFSAPPESERNAA